MVQLKHLKSSTAQKDVQRILSLIQIPTTSWFDYVPMDTFLHRLRPFSTHTHNGHHTSMHASASVQHKQCSHVWMCHQCVCTPILVPMLVACLHEHMNEGDVLVTNFACVCIGYKMDAGIHGQLVSSPASHFWLPFWWLESYIGSGQSWCCAQNHWINIGAFYRVCVCGGGHCPPPPPPFF